MKSIVLIDPELANRALSETTARITLFVNRESWCRQIARTPLLAISRGPRHGRRVRDGRANGRCRRPRGPNLLHATPSLRGSGRGADASSMPLQTGTLPTSPDQFCW